MPSYTRPAGTENEPWEDFREETGGNDSKEDYQVWLTQQKIKGRYSDVTDFSSGLYQQARAYFAKAMPSPGANSFLSALQAGGGNFGASQVQAKQQQRGAEGRRNDFLNTAVSGFALNSQGQAGGLLGMEQQGAQYAATAAEEKRRYEESKPGWLDWAGKIAGWGAGIALAPMTGGASMMIPAAMQMTKPSQQGGGGYASQGQQRY